LIDDVLDKPQQDNGVALLGTNLLLQRGLNEILAALPQRKFAKVAINESFLEAASAVLRELTIHRHVIVRYSTDELEALGSKVALLKLCATCMLLADGAENDYGALMVPIHALSTGMQLLDDLTDWEEDWREGNMTPLLTRAVSARNCPAEMPSSRDQVLLLIVSSGSMEWSIQLALEQLQIVAAANHTQDALASRLLAHIEEGYAAFLSEVSQLRSDIDKSSGINQDLKFRLDLIEKRLTILAQNT